MNYYEIFYTDQSNKWFFFRLAPPYCPRPTSDAYAIDVYKRTRLNYPQWKDWRLFKIDPQERRFLIAANEA